MEARFALTFVGSRPLDYKKNRKTIGFIALTPPRADAFGLGAGPGESSNSSDGPLV